MTKRNRNFNVRYTPDDNGMWLAEVSSSPDGKPIGVFTHGRTLAKTEANVREALAVWFDVDDEDGFVLMPQVNLEPQVISKAVKAQQKRAAARQADAEAARLTDEVVSDLAKRGLSTRDIAYIVGLSYQRVQQLLAAS